MIETESKIRVNEKEFGKIIKILGKPEFFVQKNVIYELKNGFLRLRYEKAKIVITFKGKRKRRELNSRREIELCFRKYNWDKIKKFFEYLGFEHPFIYHKKRANFSLNRCVVSIDLLPNKQSYIEVEGKKKDILKNLRVLGLSEQNIEKKSYLEILKNEKKLKGGE